MIDIDNSWFLLGCVYDLPIPRASSSTLFLCVHELMGSIANISNTPISSTLRPSWSTLFVKRWLGIDPIKHDNTQSWIMNGEKIC